MRELTCANSSKPLNGSTLGAQPAAQSTNQGLGTSTNNPAIDLAHIRSTTKFDHLQDVLQNEIQGLDTAILNMQQDCDTALAEIIPKLKAGGSELAPAIDFLSTKLEELESGLENDAGVIDSFRNGPLKQDEAELKLIYRNVNRMKVPRQYQLAGGAVDSFSGGASVLGSNNSNSAGLSGWWNQPQTLRGMRSMSAIGGHTTQIVSNEADDVTLSGPKTMIDLFDSRTEDFQKASEEQKALLTDIEDFIENLEEKILLKEREVSDRINYGNANLAERKEGERQMKLNQLGFVFGEVQKGLYEVAENVGKTRDGIVELSLLR